jgi:hypothetical protein
MASAHRLRVVLLWYLASVVVVLGAASLLAIFSSSSGSAVVEVLSAVCLLLGLAWIILGFLFAPSVGTFLAPGASWGIPIDWPRSAAPESNAPVLEDMRERLSRGTDLGIAMAALGFLLLATSIAFYLSALVGILAIVLLVGSVLALLVYSYLPPGPRQTPDGR